MADTKEYMKAYRDGLKKVCELCGGKYNQYTEAAHLLTNKHRGQAPATPVAAIPEPVTPPPPTIKVADVAAFLLKRFESSAKPSTSENNKIKRVDKHKSIWKNLLAEATKLVGAEPTAEWLTDHRLELVKAAYKTPSSQESALACLRIVLNHLTPLSEELNLKIGNECRALTAEYIASAVLKPDGMSYAKLKVFENSDNPILAIFARLFNGDMPALRLGDWLNSTVGKDKQMNEIIMGKGIMRRRISKNMSAELEINLSPSLKTYIKKNNIKGALFGTATLDDIVKLTAKELGEGNGSRYWRQKFVTEIASKFSGKDRVAVAAKMDHSVLESLLVYQRDGKGQAP